MTINTIRSNIESFYNKRKEDKNKKNSYAHNKRWNKYYGTKQWHELRTRYYNDHPCCECCEAQGIVKAADDIHHLHVFSSGPTEQDKIRLLLDYNNLCALCKYHHQMAHEYMKHYNKDEATIDEIIEYEKMFTNLN